MVWAPDYITMAQLKAYVKINDTDDDAEVASAVAGASRAIDEACNRQFGKVDAPETRYYTAYYHYERCRWAVAVDDLQSAAGLVVTVDGAPTMDYTLMPRNAVAEGKAWTWLLFGASVRLSDDEVSALGPWGWTTFPASVVQAAKLQGSRFLARRESPFGVAGSPQQGSELRLLAKLDPDVKVSLRSFQRARRVG